MGDDTHRYAAVNEGIQASTVHGNAIAAGKGARATSYESSTAPPELQQAVAQLRRAVAAFELQPRQRQALDEEISGIEAATHGGEPDRPKAEGHLKSFMDKLRAVGDVVGGVSALVDPVRKIAGALTISLPFLGL